MTREEFRDKKSKDYRKCRESYGIKDHVYLDEIEEAYYQGMVDADSYPHWISVEEIQPKKDEWFLGYSPLKSPLSSMKIDVYNFISFGQLEAHNITHWMPLPEAPKEGGKE